MVITFYTKEQANTTYEIKNVTIVKQYGRRLVLDLGHNIDNLAYERRIIQRYIADSVIESMELDFTITVAEIPINSTLIKKQSNDSDISGNIHNTSMTRSPFLSHPFQWNLADNESYSIHVENTWQYTNSTPDVIVALIDSGMAYGAESHFLNLLPGFDFISDNLLSQDGDGRDSDTTDPGDVDIECGSLTSQSWHGTRIASVLATSHRSLIKGVAQNLTVMPVRVLGTCGVGFANDLTDAIVWAAGGQINSIEKNPSPAQIISLSLAGSGPCPSYLQSAVEQAIQLGSVIIAAAGNDGAESITRTFPSNCVGVISVGASTRQGDLADYSNSGAHIVAPGGDTNDPIYILSPSYITRELENTSMKLEVTHAIGTSMAVPHVTGVLALFWKNATLSHHHVIPSTSHWVNFLLKHSIQISETCPAGPLCNKSTPNLISGSPTLETGSNQTIKTMALPTQNDLYKCPLGTFGTAGNQYGTPGTSGLNGVASNLYNYIANGAAWQNYPYTFGTRCWGTSAWVQYDMGSTNYFHSIYGQPYTDSRVYCLWRYEISTTGMFAGEQTTVFSCGFPNTYCSNLYTQGTVVSITPTLGRYIRWYLGSSDFACCNGAFFIQLLVGFGSLCNSCTKCTAGQYTKTACTTSANTLCQNCGAGTFSPVSDSSLCQQCTAGTFSSGSGSSACQLCTAGTFSSGSGSSVCQLCNAGTFSSSSGSSVCQQCNSGTFFSGAGSSSGSMCIQCNSGTFTSISGSSVCQQCSGGTYSPALNSPVCNELVLTADIMPTWIPPVTVDFVFVKVWGAGGGSTNYMNGGNGGAGGYGHCLLNISTITSLSIVVGIGGIYTANGGEAGGMSAIRVGSRPILVSGGGGGGGGWGGLLSSCDTRTFNTRCACVGISNGGNGGGPTPTTCSGNIINCWNIMPRSPSCTSFGEPCPHTSITSVAAYLKGAAGVSSATCSNPSYPGTQVGKGGIGCDGGQTTTSMQGARGCGGGGAGYFDPLVCSQVLSTSSPQDTITAPQTQNLPTGYNSNTIGKGGTLPTGNGLPGLVVIQYLQNCKVNMGTWDITDGNLKCKLTTTGTTTPQCTPGTFSTSSGSTVCYNCFSGTYSSISGSLVCQDCQAGTYSSQSVSTTCQICQAGTFSPFIRSSMCYTCNAGTYSPVSGSSVCQNCQAGTFSPVSGSSVCQNCFTGTFAPLSGSSVCQNCQAGSFASLSGSLLCQKCQAGTFSPVSGSSVCQNCQVGAFSPFSDSSVCQNCQAGTYSPVSGSSVCQNCQVGTFSPVSGSSVCQNCFTGTFAPLSGSSVCQNCQAGTYSPVSGSSVCQNCQVGTYSPVSGSSVCQNCFTGTFAPLSGSSVCQNCFTGTFASLSGSSVCQNCFTGTFAPVSGSSVCHNCFQGTFASFSGSSVCQNCVTGTYSPVSGSTVCQNCFTGTFASLSGSTVCQNCQAGTYSHFSGSSTCQNCTAGTFSFVSGSSACQNCTAGNYSTVRATGCFQCDVGFTSLEASSVCTPIPIPSCPIGSYGTSPDCSPCPPNTNSSFNRTSTLLDCRCLPGYVCSYTKRINVYLTLKNITWDMLTLSGIANSPVIDAIALAAGVHRENVIINGMFPTSSSRRMMRASGQFLGDVRHPKGSTLPSPAATEPMTIWAKILDATTFNDALATTLLDPYLVDALSWTHGHTIRVAREWGSLM